MAWKFFPCVPGGKEPALSGDWRAHATDDEGQIQAWLDAGYNLALLCDGLTVIDLDPGAERPPDLPPTFERTTPRGGSHVFYEGSTANTVGKLGRHIDTRSDGGYVLVDPSHTEAGAYGGGNGLPIAPLPDFLRQRLYAERSGTRALSDGNDVGRLVEWLQGRAPAIEGQGGNDHTYRTMAAALDLVSDIDLAVGAALEHWNERCLPPWDADELRTIAEHALEYRQNEAGAWAAGDPVQRFGTALAVSVEAREEPNPYKLWRVSEALARPPPEWIMPDTIPREVLLLLYGLPEAGKSWIALDLALHVASGRPGWGRPGSEPEDVVFFCGEGFSDLAHNRITSWCEARGIPLPAVSDRLRLLENFPNLAGEQELKRLADAINAERLKPALIVLDTYARVMAESGLGENDPKEVMAFVRQAERIKRGFGCTVMPIHHSGKDTERGARGSNSLIAAVDVAYEMVAHWEPRVFQLTCQKMKIATKPSPMHFEAKPAGSGLVFDPITTEEYRNMTTAADELDERKISAALVSAKAFGHDSGVTTQALACMLYSQAPGEDPLSVVAGQRRLARHLAAAGRKRLGGYCADGVWFIAVQ